MFSLEPHLPASMLLLSKMCSFLSFSCTHASEGRKPAEREAEHWDTAHISGPWSQYEDKETGYLSLWCWTPRRVWEEPMCKVTPLSQFPHLSHSLDPPIHRLQRKMFSFLPPEGLGYDLRNQKSNSSINNDSKISYARVKWKLCKNVQYHCKKIKPEIFLYLFVISIVFNGRMIHIFFFPPPFFLLISSHPHHFCSFI